jgi:zinc protease
VLTIAGDFEPSAARAMIERHFGAIPRGGGRPPLPPVELPPTFGAWVRETVQDAVAAPRLFLAFRIPPFGADSWYTASLLGSILGDREGSRLPRALVREQAIASAAGAYTFDLPKGSDLLICDVTGRPGLSGEVARAGGRGGDRPRDRRRRDAGGTRAGARGLETAWVAGLQSAAARADKLSQYATYFGDAARVNDELARYRAVTVDALGTFARARLGPDNRASLLYVPRTAPAEAA